MRHSERQEAKERQEAVEQNLGGHVSAVRLELEVDWLHTLTLPVALLA